MVERTELEEAFKKKKSVDLRQVVSLMASSGNRSHTETGLVKMTLLRTKRYIQNNEKETEVDK